MSAMCNFTANQWIESGLIDNIPLDQVSGCWPWQRLAIDEWSSINKSLMSAYLMYRLSLVFTIILCPIGIAGSLLVAFAVYRKAFVKKQRFYKWMFAISILDFVYDSVYTASTIFRGTLFPSMRTYQYFSNEILSRLVGIITGFSLSSDLCTLCLTIERVLTLKQKSEDKKTSLFTMVEIFFILILGGLRLAVIDAQYVVREIGTDSSGSKKFSIFNNEQVIGNWWWNWLNLLSSTATPFILLFLMICLTSIIAILVYKRRSSRIFDQKSIQQQKIAKEASAIIRLCFCLSFLFVCGQLGYCLNTVGSAMNSMAPISFSSTYVDLTSTTSVYYFQYGSLFLLRAGDCSSKSLNFFFYCLFTPSFRDEIKKRWRKGASATVSTIG